MNEPATSKTLNIKPVDEPKGDKEFYICDLSAKDPGVKRDHQMIIDGALKTFSFSANKPTRMSRAAGIKFLRHSENFRRTDKDGNEILWQATPTQPGDLQAGQTLVLADGETIARYDEMHIDALRVRAMQLPDGERFADAENRDEIIAFIISKQVETAKKNSKNDMAPDEFVPEPEIED